MTMLKRLLRPLIPAWTLDLYHQGQAVLAALWYRFPARGLRVIAVTGTNGKTTTSFFTESILRAAKQRVGMITTVAISVDGKVRPNDTKMTTVTPWLLNRWLREIRDRGCTWVVLEATSHALAQHRLWGVPIDTAVFTNLTHDHLDYHKTPEAYLAAKAQLFAMKPRVTVLNADDEAGKQLGRYPTLRRYWYSIGARRPTRSKGEWVVASNVATEPTSSEFSLVSPDGTARVRIHLGGRFNVANALAAAAAALGANVVLDTVTQGLEALAQVPGRMEAIDTGQPFSVVVDYAHTPDALRQVFETVKPRVTGRLIHVGGATGDRDRTKRPILGALAGRYADITIVTDEDPGSEDPITIIEAVAEGVRRGSRTRRVEGENLFVITNRGDAIRTALKLARAGDLVLITGKGHERVMAVGDKHVPFSDVETVKAALAQS